MNQLWSMKTVALSLAAVLSGCGGGSADTAPKDSAAAVTPTEGSAAALAAAAASEPEGSASAVLAASAAQVATPTQAQMAPAAKALAARAGGTGNSTTSNAPTAQTAAPLAAAPAVTLTTVAPQIATGAGAVTATGSTVSPSTTATVQAATPLATTADADYAPLLARLRAEYLTISAWQADAAIRTITDAGDWSDVNYADRSVGAWAPMTHLERTRALAIVYASPTGRYSGSAAVRDAVVRAVAAWRAKNPQSDNWWHNTIGAQLVMMPILVLMGSDLPADLQAYLVSQLTPYASVPSDRKTGQNLVWYATQSVVRGAMTRNSSDIAIGRDAMRSTLPITTAEGLQADYSFQQHGNQLYSGGYGLTYLIDMVHIATWLDGTAWDFSAADMNRLADYTLFGIAPLVRGNWLDWGARGRELTRQESVPRATALQAPVKSLITLAPARAKELGSLLTQLTGGTGPTQATTTGYWRSDFVAHQTPTGYFSVKMFSKRTVGTESGNGENLLGYWLPFGTTFIVRDGSEYLGLQPVLSWSELPGTTAPAFVPSFSGYLKTTVDRVALLTSANNGMASMQVNTQGLTAKKFWFLDGDTMVALGSDISYTGAQVVRTTLNQTRLNGSVSTNISTLLAKSSSQRQAKLQWVAHAGVGYLMLDQQLANLTIEERSLTGADPTNTAFGASASTFKPVQMLTVSIDHGTRPQGASYAYAVFHGINSAAQLRQTPRPKVLVNTAVAQGVLSADGQRFAITFHQAGTVALAGGLSLQAEQAMSVLGQIINGQVQVQMTDATGSGGSLALRTLKNGVLIERKTITSPSNLQRSIDAPSASVSLLAPS